MRTVAISEGHGSSRRRSATSEGVHSHGGYPNGFGWFWMVLDGFGWSINGYGWFLLKENPMNIDWDA